MSLVVQELSKRLLLKHTATVHSSSRLTMVQKKIFNLFIYKAFPTIKEDKYHTFKVSDLMQSLNWSADSHMNDRLKEALAGLTRENVKWNVLEKDRKNKWVSSACLADVSIKSGVIEFSFGKFLREVLHNPNIYAKIDLDVQSNLESRDSLIIWEVAMEELSSKKTNATITPWIEWEKMCSITSGEGSAYTKTYSLYKSKVLNKAIAEINAKTDLNVTMLEQKESRRVKSIAFKVIRQEKAAGGKSSGVMDSIAFDRDLTLQGQLQAIFGVPEKTQEIWVKYPDETIRGAINYYMETLTKHPYTIKNPIAFLKKALEEGWHPLADALSRIGKITDQFEKGEGGSVHEIDHLNEPETTKMIRKKILNQFGETVYNAWFKAGTFFVEENTLFVVHPNAYTQAYIQQKLYHPLLDIVRESYPGIVSITVTQQLPQTV
ncbi:MAG: RepB family plasmid replication initiator protein [Alphaproteobacteria bacterium]|nr:RepB family plasmid replication initiator protein [Alphaproteobacteria bacterium]